MGTLLEVIAAGCIPITTRASGIDDAVLNHSIIVEAENPLQHRQAIAEVLGWTTSEFKQRQRALQRVATERHNWNVFDRQVREVLWP